MFTNLFRLGKDAELRSTPSGDPVCELSLAYNYGRKGDDGKQPSQWLKASIWGKRAEALAPHLKKGGSVVASIEDLHVKTREHEGKTYTDLVGRIAAIQFAGGKREEGGGGTSPRQAENPKDAGGKAFEDDDIPFITSHSIW